EKQVVERRTQRLRDAGISFHQNVDIGQTMPFSDLRKRHTAVLIATGVYKPRELAAPGSGLAGIVPA
ncbi:MAG TPA: dihydropyrimidine dehydrogenase, partial [Alphaproteobacteria bacterium]|nr:dihydropyrimidine dehydrogenase [Alphaproteobacteria bacterium]